MAKFYVGVKRSGDPGAELRILVVPEANGIPSHLDKVRTITADDEEKAAVKYMEQTTGGTGAVRKPD